MDAATTFRRFAAGFNERVMLPLLDSPVGAALGASTAVVSYTGRRSGKQVTLPVMYRRKGDIVVIGVTMPSAKTWWRNFRGEGARMRLDLGGEVREAHAIAVERDNGAVRVRAVLDAVEASTTKDSRAD